jgi:hypothetical protein
MQDDKLTPWAALIIEPDGTVAVYVHNWIRAGRASNPEELWKLTHEAWSTPEKFWGLFYAALGRREAAPINPKLKSLSIEDLGL